MADVDPKPIGMMNPASRFYNDNIPAKSPLKKAAEEKMQKRFTGRPMLSQYAPQLGEMERMNAAKNQKMEEQQMLFNKLASSPMMEKAMNNLVEPLLALEGVGAIGGAAKALYKSGLKKAVKKEANDYASSLTQNNVTRYFDKEGKELPFTTAIRSKDEVIKANQALKKDFKTGSASAPPEGLSPYLTDENGEKLGLDWKDIEKYDPAFYLKSNKIKEADQVLLDFRNRISTPEGEKRMKNLLGDRYEKVKDNINKLELKEDPSDYAYYTSGVMTDPYIGLHPELNTEMVKPIVRHEIEHAVQKGATTEVDDILSNLELKKTPNKVNWDERKLDKQINPQNLKYKLKDRQDATDYFDSGSSGREKGAFLGELQQYMVDNKLISHPYAVNEITPSKIRDVFIDNIGQDNYPLRIFNIMKPTDKNYKILADGLNKMLIGGGAIAGAKNILGQKNVKQ
jgi:hypothetical protein